ncbi:MAG: Zn-dependent alcohol dehydrogenase [Proteobacteria bacterium]|nr:Zn-dependent alcohol dehydrogenase [Pseudomonadota bacterium]
MRAAVLTAVDRDLEVRDDLVLVDAGPGEVRLRMGASGVCHSDVSFQNGTIPVALPCVIGHEGSGEVIQVGDGVEHLALGDRVIISWTPPCGSCPFCLGHQPNLCTVGMGQAAAPKFSLGSDPVFGGPGTPTFAEETVIPAIAAIKVDPETPYDVGALIGCGVMTGVGAAINTAAVKPGSTVLVIGAGGVGISAIQGARVAGAAVIVAVDTVEKKLQWAKQFGATHATTPEGLNDLKQNLTGGLGFDYAFEVVGSAATIRSAWDQTRRGGTTCVVGVARMDQMVQFSAMELFYSEKKLVGSYYGSADVRTDFSRLLRMWKNDQLDLEGMITARIDLGEINQAFQSMLNGEVIRTVVEF